MSFYSNNGHGDMIFGDISISRADRQPCPVCGHPTGDCVNNGFKPPERILLHGTTPSLEEEQTFFVEEDVFEERAISAFTTVKVLLARKGSSIPFARARELGLL